jgi:hypothetical protein
VSNSIDMAARRPDVPGQRYRSPHHPSDGYALREGVHLGSRMAGLAIGMLLGATAFGAVVPLVGHFFGGIGGAVVGHKVGGLLGQAAAGCAEDAYARPPVTSQFYDARTLPAFEPSPRVTTHRAGISQSGTVTA